ncbi:hypothetical protein PPERSA_12262 [Pseudocohnilembus persalinus]|uniref:ubiquitinyl hydrolase 1 n=1 Tax=Pseudocohnilembus persalinus TaxID=266149 RepID=A0A0V0R4V7_PSEPJ|nr:hypothetical protein PPERSA_12262 [Pseudocohnilembus persalinus]|eukprot:KRX09519.1 hypothetical protein PPERSA_12262 [Pseudocohnilembus persalinus]
MIQFPKNLPKIKLTPTNIEEIKKNIQKKQDTNIKANEYKEPKIIQAIQKMRENCKYFRGIRGDGNCFYRAFGVGYVINLVQNQNPKVQKELQSLIDILNKNQYQYQKIQEIPYEFQYLINKNLISQILLQGLNFLYERRNELDFEDRVYQLFNESYEFDFCLIIYLRSETVSQLEQQKDFLQFDDQFNRILKEAKTYGNEAEGYSAELLPVKLKVLKVTHQVSKNDGYNMNPKDINLQENQLFQIHLFFRPGHYDFCYDTKNLQNFQKIPHEIKSNSNQNQIQSLKTQQINEKQPKFQFKKCKLCKAYSNDLMKNEKNNICQICQNKSATCQECFSQIPNKFENCEKCKLQEDQTIIQMQQNKNKLDQTIQKLNNQIKQKNDNIDRQGKNINQLQNQIKKHIQKIKDQEELISKKDSEIETQNKKISAFQNDKKNQSDKIKQNEDQIKQLTENAEKDKNKITDQQSKIQEQETQIQQFKNQKECYEKQISNLKEENQKQKSINEQQQNNDKNQKDKIQEQQEKLQKYEDNFNTLTKQIEEIKDQKENLRKANQQLNKKYNEQENNYKNQIQKLKTQQQENLYNQVDECNNIINQKQNEIEKMKQEIIEQKQNNQHLETNLNDQEQLQNEINGYYKQNVNYLQQIKDYNDYQITLELLIQETQNENKQLPIIKFAEAQKIIHKKKNEIQDLQNKNILLSDQIEVKEKELKKYKNQIQNLRQDIENFRDNNTQDQKYRLLESQIQELKQENKKLQNEFSTFLKQNNLYDKFNDFTKIYSKQILNENDNENKDEIVCEEKQQSQIQQQKQISSEQNFEQKNNIGQDNDQNQKEQSGSDSSQTKDKIQLKQQINEKQNTCEKQQHVIEIDSNSESEKKE